MKRHYNNYFKGIPNFKKYKMTLVTSNNAEEIEETLNIIYKEFKSYSFEKNRFTKINDGYQDDINPIIKVDINTYKISETEKLMDMHQ